MNNSKSTKKSIKEKHAKNKEWPIVVYLWMIGLAFLGYVIGRIVLSTSPHPYHWISGLAGGVIGIIVGWIWYWKLGDI